MIQVLLPLVMPLIDKLVGLIPDPNAREKAKNEAIAQFLEMSSKSQSEQVEVNKVEAAHPSIFVAGWRPFIGWCCGVTLAYHFILLPILAYCFTIWSPGTPLPSLPIDNMFELVFAMLGLGGLRTFEKIKGVSR